VTARDLGTHDRGECLVEAKHAARAHERAALVQAGHGQGRGCSIQAGRVAGGARDRVALVQAGHNQGKVSSIQHGRGCSIRIKLNQSCRSRRTWFLNQVVEGINFLPFICSNYSFI
jgi:hypothetical protein